MLGAMNSRLAAVETVSKPITHTELESVTKQRQAETHFANQLINIGKISIKFDLVTFDRFHIFRSQVDFVWNCRNKFYIGQLKPEQIARKLLVDDSFKQSKRELQLVVVLDQEIVVFAINTWSGTYKPGPDGKFWLKRTEYEESITVEQIKSPLVELQVCFRKIKYNNIRIDILGFRGSDESHVGNEDSLGRWSYVLWRPNLTLFRNKWHYCTRISSNLGLV